MSSDEEKDEVQDLVAIRDKMRTIPRSEQVSAWEDDNDGIEDERNAKEPNAKALLDAAENGDLDEMRRLVRENPLLIHCSDKDGYTPLHRACYNNKVNIIEYLLELGAKIDAETQDGWQPLHSACYWNNTQSAEILITNGANINAKSKGDQTPLHLLSSSSHNSHGLQLLLLHPDTNPHIVNSSGDTADQIARRTTTYYPMYEIIEPCLNEI